MFNDAPQAALGFLIAQTTHIEREAFEVKYPDIQYPELIPVDTSANAWATSVTYMSTDMAGQAQWINGGAGDVPFVDLEREKFETPVAMAGVGYRYTLEEIAQAQMLGINLTADKPRAARRVYEELVDKVAIEGDARKNFLGLINQTSVTRVTVPNGAGASPLWTIKTADEILKDINDAVTGVWTGSNTVELSDTVLLPLDRFALITTKRIGADSAMTVYDFIQKSNIYTAITGQPLKIRSMRKLDTAGLGATKRMITYKRDPEVLKLHLPMALRFLPPQSVGFRIEVPGMFRLGGLDVRRPGAMRYSDGI